MSGIKIEVYDNEDAANERAAFFSGKGFAVTGPKRYEWATWANHTTGGVTNQALDPSDLEVWLLIAEK